MRVAVIGMHRSGTSLVSRLLNLSGLYIGEEADMVPATESNERGHWEHTQLLDINVRLLSRFGGWWAEPPAFPDGWLRDANVAALQHDASARLVSIFGEDEQWGWKEPRTTLTIPFWRRIVPELRFVVCVRNPLDAASSLAARDHAPTSAAVALWHWYTEMALRLTRQEERIIVHYEDLLIDYRKALAPVLEFCGLPALVPGSARDAAVAEFVDLGLMHHFYTYLDVMHSPDVLTRTRELYTTLVCRPGVINTHFKPASAREAAEMMDDVRAAIVGHMEVLKGRYPAELPSAAPAEASASATARER